MATYYSNPITRKFIINSDLFNITTIFFRKVADTISVLAQFDFEEKVQHFHNIQDLIKEGKPVEFIIARGRSATDV